MALSIPNQQDPQDEQGVEMRSPYGWIADLRISYSDNRASLTFWIHRSPGAAATWPSGSPRIEPARRITISCGDPVQGYPDVTFPEFSAIEDRAVAGAIDTMTALGLALTPEQSAALATIATGGAIRAALYAYLRELVFPTATEVE